VKRIHSVVRSRWFGPVVLALVALVARVVASRHYWGWEEEDFTNVNLAWAMLQHGADGVSQDYPPVFYALSALLGLVLEPIDLATLTVTMAGGVATVVLAFVLGRAVWNDRVGWLAGLLCCLQPQLLLYSSSPLREPFYAAISLLGVWFVLRRRHAGAAASFGLAGLTRYEGTAANLPFHLAAVFVDRVPLRRLVGPALAWAGLFAAWVVFQGVQTGEWNPLSNTFAMNVTDAPTSDRDSAFEWLGASARVSVGFWGWVFPQMLGPLLPLAALGALVTALRSSDRERRLLAAWFGLQLGLFAGIVFVGQFDPPGHPLYRKWSTLLCALVCLFGAAGLDGFFALARRRGVGRGLRGAVAAAALLVTAVPFAAEIDEELTRSERTVAPQVRIAHWLEASYPRGTAFLLDQITLFRMDRRDHGFELLQWGYLPAWSDDGRGWAEGPEALGRYLAEKRVRVVLWCKEEWTQGPVIAPYLEAPEDHELGPVTLRLMHADEAYGFRLYQVVY